MTVIRDVLIAEPFFGAEFKGTMRVHDPDLCAGEFCPIHNPSDHVMKNFPLNFRMDRMALVERICPHGVGHPDPDSLAYFKRKLGAKYPRYAMGVHGCDGCCHA